MASSSSSSSSVNWRYDVFVSYYGPDVESTFLSHLRKELSDNGMEMFDDQGIERGQTIPEPTQVIRESRISIVVLSKKYASSSWCLDELFEIVKCDDEDVNIVIPVFYKIAPSDVRELTGEFGIVFNETCARKTKEVKRKWSQALNYVVGRLGFSLNCDNDQADLLEEIAREVSKKLNTRISRDFVDMVGLETHLEKIQSLLHFANEDEAIIVGVYGPAGIGKTAIARALHSRFSCSFQPTCFMEDIRGSYNSGLPEYGMKLQLQDQLLSKILNQNDMVRIYHLDAIRERLSGLKVLIILDDVDDLKQLEALANETTWFGPGSRIIVTTEDQELLRQHGIDNTYHVDLPSSQEALQILCRYAFRKSYPPNGFQELAKRVVEQCANLPLSLLMVGSFLHGKKEEEWEEVIRRVEPHMDHRDIEQVLRVLNETSSSKKRKSKFRCLTGMAFFVVINLLLEIASAVADQLSSIRKPNLARISLAMSILSVVLSILDLTYKVRAHKAGFRCKWPMPWFYFPSRGYRKVFGSIPETVLLFCVVGGLVVSTINYSFIEKGKDGPIKVSIWPLFFAIGMVASKFMEKPVISKDN